MVGQAFWMTLTYTLPTCDSFALLIPKLPSLGLGVYRRESNFGWAHKKYLFDLAVLLLGWHRHWKHCGLIPEVSLWWVRWVGDQFSPRPQPAEWENFIRRHRGLIQNIIVRLLLGFPVPSGLHSFLDPLAIPLTGNRWGSVQARLVTVLAIFVEEVILERVH